MTKPTAMSNPTAHISQLNIPKVILFICYI